MSRHNPVPIFTTEICHYGCGTAGRYRFKSGKVCCSDAVQKCQGHIHTQINTKRKDIDPVTGLNALQRGQAGATLRKKETGAFEKAGRKISDAKQRIVDSSGRRQCDISNAKMKETLNAIGNDGSSIAKRSAKKAANTRRMDIDENGLNQYQRWTNTRIKNGIFEQGFKKSHLINQFKNTKLYYQGSYELKFLELLEEQHGIDWVIKNVNRGPTIKYTDRSDYTRNYLSDFIIGNTVYEIKSNWTWNRRGKDLEMEQNNINKLNAALANGYKVILIREGKEIEFKKTW